MHPDRRLVPSSDTDARDREHRRLTILVIDDEQPILAMLQEMLQDEGYTVLLAGNGQAGLERAIDDRPDLILTDLMMPVMDGRTLCRHLRAEPRTTQIPLIGMSAAYWPRDGDAFDAVLAKPFNIDDVLELLRAQLDGSQ
jgi:two-component system, OmpR family, alkaline phosphatase synthesis response regulator PhoP